jgi:hypothetical protein
MALISLSLSSLVTSATDASGWAVFTFVVMISAAASDICPSYGSYFATEQRPVGLAMH